MTYKETLTKYLSTTTPFDTPEKIEMHDLIWESLRKQIPQKPAYYTFMGEQQACCPNCRDDWDMNEYGEGMKYCWNCGQAIDWGED